MSKKLALCIPTYNRSKEVEKLLQDLSAFTGDDFVIYIFDSSESDDTRLVVDRYAGAQVFYEFVTGAEYSNQKVFRIYERMTESEADYVWLMNDHSVFNDAALDFIRRALAEDGDFYLLDVRCPAFAVTDFKDLDDFLLRAAWQLTYYGAGIVKRESFLEGVDWDYLAGKYLTAETMEYSQLGFYFERASQMPRVKLKQIGLLRDSMLDRRRYEKPAWQKDKFRICTQCWHEVIMRLPEAYKAREKALGTMDSWYLSRFSLMEMKEDGGYGLFSLLRYGRFLRRIAPEMAANALWIALLPLWLCRRLLTGKLLGKIKAARKAGRRVYVYGAGRHGVDCTNYLESCGIVHDGFLVTELEGNPRRIREYPVYAAGEKLGPGCLVILAFLSNGQSPVEVWLDELRANGMDIECIGAE